MANYTSVVASNICDAAGNKLASGTVSFQATDAGNQPLNFQVGGGGQVVTTPAVAGITAGTIAGGFQVADSANTSPAGILYRITITDTTLNRVVVTYSLVTVTGTTFNLDNYVPTGASVLPPTGGSVNGPLTVTGNLSVTGSFNPGTLGNVTSTGTVLAKNIEGIRCVDQFAGADLGARINAAIADSSAAGSIVFVPGSTASTSWTTPVSITKPICLLFDEGVWTYSGVSQALLVNAGGVSIVGAGNGNGQPSGSSVSGGTQIVVTGTAVKGIDLNAAPGIVMRNLTLLGPNSGTGLGLVITANSGYVENVQVRAFGSDGVTIDGTRGNSNLVNLVRVTAVSNKGWGFNVFGLNSNLIIFQNTAGSANVLGNYQIASATNVFIGALSEASGTGTGFTFLSGSNHNWGNLYSEIGNEATAVNLNTGASDNYFYLSSQLAFVNNGVNNTIYTIRQLQGAGSIAGPAYSFVGSQSTGLWDVGNAIGFSANGTDAALISSGTMRGRSGFVFGWTSAAGASGGGNDTGLSRISAGVVAVGNGANGDGSGQLQTGSATIGAGTLLSRYARYSVNISPASVAANTTAEQSFASAVTAGDVIIGISKPTSQAGLGIVGHRSSGTTLFITFSNNTASPITPTASETYQVVAVQ